MAHLPQIARVLTGEQLFPAIGERKAYHDDSDGREPVSPYWPIAIHPDAKSGYVKASRYRSFSEAPAGSVALIPVTGPITKYLGDCGEAGNEVMTNWVKEADGSGNISGILLKIDSPGGQVDGTRTLVDALSNTGKRTIGFVDDGMACSAAMWIGAACDDLYCSQATDTVGSIGVLSTLADYRGFFEQKGIKIHEIYAPQSTDKNADYREALEGNYDKVKADLQVLAQSFIDSMRTLRGNKLNTSVDNPFTGKTYYAPQALEIGLIDGIMPFEKALLKAAGEL